MQTRIKFTVALLASLALFGCAWTDDQLKEATEEVGFWGSMFGAQGITASGIITGAMMLAVKGYRMWKGSAELTTMAASNAAAFKASKSGASDDEIAAILSAGIPGTTTTVKPAQVAEMVAEASSTKT